MIKKNKFLCLGFSKNQKKLVELSKKNDNINYVIANKKEIQKNLNVDKFILGSVYNHFLIIKKLKKINYIDDVIFRSSGPAILSYHKILKKYKIKRVSSILAKAVYSKNKLLHYLSDTFKCIPKVKENDKLPYVVKPDAPSIGKKNIFLLKNNKKKYHFLSKKVSDNKKTNLTKFISGDDITLFYLITKNKKKLIFIDSIQEINFFDEKGKLNGSGTCAPPITKFKLSRNLLREYGIKFQKKFKDYYGFFTMSFKINSEGLYLYEINLGLSGDNIVDKIINPRWKLNLFEIEIKNLMRKDLTLSILSKKNEKFIGLLKNQKIYNRKKFQKKLKLCNVRKKKIQ